MTATFIGCLAVAFLYVARRNGGLRAENAQLRNQVASLKRQLKNNRA
jgi:hypothetical protein